VKADERNGKRKIEDDEGAVPAKRARMTEFLEMAASVLVSRLYL
jgi:hypothetical protein